MPYLPSGEEVCVRGMIGDLIVVEVLMQCYDNGQSYSLPAQVRLVDTVLDEEPVPLFSDELKAVKDEIAEAKIELRQLREETAAASAEHDLVVDSLKDAGVYQMVDDAVNRRFTHIVHVDGHSVTVKAITEALSTNDAWSKDLRLLSLYGRSTGKLWWALNEYSDGSGRNYEVHPFASEAAATQKAREVVSRLLRQVMDGELSEYYCGRVIKSARQLGVSVPPAVVDKHKSSLIEVASRDVEDAKLKLSKAEAKLKAIKHENQ